MPLSLVIAFPTLLIITNRFGAFLSLIARFLLYRACLRTNSEEPIIIKHSSIFQKSSVENQESFRSWLQKFILDVTLQIAMVSNIDSFTSKIFRDDGILGRALNFSDVSVALENILGQAYRFNLSDWEKDAGEGRYALRRTLPWNHGVSDIKSSESEPAALRPGTGAPPPDLIDIDKLKHKDQRVVSFINLPLWDKAEWRATAYIKPPGSIPMLVLGFKNSGAAKQIFKEWQNKIGKIDKEDEIRVSIITGIDNKRPSSYTVIISANPNFAKNKETHYVLVTRMNRMDPPNLNHLNAFIEQYKQAGQYMLLPAHFVTENKFPDLFLDYIINKKVLNIRPAWQIGEHDADVVAISEDDDPIIPDDHIIDAPVIAALKRFSKRPKK